MTLALVGKALDELPAVSLHELDQRASLLRRTDTKYLVEDDVLASVIKRLADDHEVLEIDGRRIFSYQSIYFDSPDLRCFHDHAEGRVPRFKARTRMYRDTGYCTFEVKLKLPDGETDKRQVAHALKSASRIDGEAIECLKHALARVELSVPEQSLEPSLRTEFLRITLAPKEGRERTTCDLDLRLRRGDLGLARIRDGLAVIETKSEGGESPTDRLMEEMGIEPISFSKYRAGIALLAAGADDPDYRRRAESILRRDHLPA